VLLTLKRGTESVPETLEGFNTITRLVAREDFTELKNEFGKMWKKAVVACLKYISATDLE
jgi:hypothetical protein